MFVAFGGPPDPLPNPFRTPFPGPGIDSQGPGTRSPGHPEHFPDRHKIEERPIQIQKHPQTSSTATETQTLKLGPVGNKAGNQKKTAKTPGNLQKPDGLLYQSPHRSGNGPGKAEPRTDMAR